MKKVLRNEVVVIPISCGECVACRNGKTNCCTNISVLGVHDDGGMQEQIAVPVDILLPANHLSDDQMAIVEPLAIGAHAEEIQYFSWRNYSSGWLWANGLA